MTTPTSKLRTGALIAASAAALVLSGTANSATLEIGNAAGVHCVGANACKGSSDCKTAGNACKGHNACKTANNACKGHSACQSAANACNGQNECKGHGMKVKASAAECDAAGGHVES